METLLASVLDQVLVGANTGGLEGLGAQLLILVGDEVDAEREVVNVGTLAAKIEDANLGVGHTTVEARLGVRLEVHILAARPLLLFIPRFDLIKHQASSIAICHQEPSSQYQSKPQQFSRLPQNQPTHLVLAVAVATGGTTSHLDGIRRFVTKCW